MLKILLKIFCLTVLLSNIETLFIAMEIRTNKAYLNHTHNLSSLLYVKFCKVRFKLQTLLSFQIKS